MRETSNGVLFKVPSKRTRNSLENYRITSAWIGENLKKRERRGDARKFSREMTTTKITGKFVRNEKEG